MQDGNNNSAGIGRCAENSVCNFNAAKKQMLKAVTGIDNGIEALEAIDDVRNILENL